MPESVKRFARPSRISLRWRRDMGEARDGSDGGGGEKAERWTASDQERHPCAMKIGRDDAAAIVVKR